MIIIYLLDENDVIYPDDYIRPLNRIAEFDQYASEWCYKNPYTGKICDSLKWTKVSDILGDKWFKKGKKGKKWKSYFKGSKIKYEVISFSTYELIDKNLSHINK